MKKALAIKRRTIIEDAYINKVIEIDDVPFDTLNKLVKKLNINKDHKTENTKPNPVKYNTQFRKNIRDKLKDINNYDLFVEVYKLIINHNVIYSVNNNGVFFELNKLDDDIIECIMNLITNYEVDNEYIPLVYDNKYDKKSYNEIYNNLSIKEKNYLKRYY